MTNARLYASIWRWHFYAGLIVAPFFLIAAMSGIVMALKAPIEALAYGDRLTVTAQARPLTADEQMAAVSRGFPHADLLTYIPPKTPERSAQFIMAAHEELGGPAHGDHGADHSGAPAVTVFVNPYTAEILGTLDPETTLYSFAKTLHGTLFLGAVGDHMIEVAAGFGVLMIVTGLFLWAPRRGQSLTSAVTPRLSNKNRTGWRGLHGAVGFWVSLVMLFFLISGLAWTPVWGGRLVQAWSSVPAASVPKAVPLAHEALNHGDRKNVPWALEQTPLPMAKRHGAHDGGVDLDDIVALARRQGFTGFRVHFPKPQTGAWTIAAATISGDIADPRRDRTVHVDAQTGDIIADIGFADYPLMGKAMAAGVPLHQGDLGVWNIVLNVVFCIAVITMIATGFVMWWLRRPRKGLRLSPPPVDRRAWSYGALLMFAASLLFPLTAATLIAVIAADYLAFASQPKAAQ